ncbi:hypothetical protein JHK82_054737 [Glycine max]|uniref:Uncharacterized protein n=1 Tax=Glycine max TaxID=3847 RepID=K7N0E3_SOYBN|nr:hypothetical protein JHK86_054588 [Glycine max]KAG4917092.1 hypothetical protein JHK87_054649 [Glycine soja]KAG4929057.1 hypothetical protein JHK85_055543 [Glycine max]KAG5087340.1 hypothetical protein JHK82_054737 [Glycine max]KAH1079623.1 hypothetical protein GYH30_054266 [Glycine max]
MIEMKLSQANIVFLIKCYCYWKGNLGSPTEWKFLIYIRLWKRLFLFLGVPSLLPSLKRLGQPLPKSRTNITQSV